MKSDYEIAQDASIRFITTIAADLGIPSNLVIPYGHYKAKINISHFDEEKIAKSTLILVTAITAAKAGIGKTTTSIGLADGLKKLLQKCMAAKMLFCTKKRMK